MQQTKDILKQVKRLEISTKHLVDGLITGNYHSIFKGQGIEFSEIREYKPGDDVRAIDWNVTARFNHPYIKEFIEERDLQVYFVLDMSGSSSFGNNITKKTKSIEIMASLMFAALQSNDNIGTFLFTDKIEQYIPARKGRRHVFRVLDTILSFNAKGITTNLETTLVQVSKILKRKSVLIIISDFMDSSEYYFPLKILRARHDVIALKITDLREQEIPNVGLIELEDEETGEQILVDTSDETFLENYSKNVAAAETQLVKNLRKVKIDYIKILSDQEHGVALKKFFKQRQRR